MTNKTNISKHGQTTGSVSLLLYVWLAALAMAFVSIAGCGNDNGGIVRKDVAVPPQSQEMQPTYTSLEREQPTVHAPDPEPVRIVSYEEAESAYLEKRYDEASELFALYTGQNDDNSWGFYMLGLSEWKSGDLAKAEDAFEKALELDEGGIKSWLNLSRVLLDAERPTEALAKIEEATEIDPESNIAYRLRGRALHELEQADDAVAAYRKALTIDEEDAWSMNNMALVFIEQERFEEALPPLARATELRDNVATFFNNLGIALERSGYLAESEEAYASAIALDETHERAIANHERVQQTGEAANGDSALAPLELGVLANHFTDQIRFWADEEANKDVVDADLGTAELVVVPPDSTEGDPLH